MGTNTSDGGALIVLPACHNEQGQLIVLNDTSREIGVGVAVGIYLVPPEEYERRKAAMQSKRDETDWEMRP